MFLRATSTLERRMQAYPLGSTKTIPRLVPSLGHPPPFAWDESRIHSEGFGILSGYIRLWPQRSTMDKRALAVLLVLTTPLLMYGIPYAAAATSSSDYVVTGSKSTG